MKVLGSLEKDCGFCVASWKVPLMPSSADIFQPDEGAESSEKRIMKDVKREPGSHILKGSHSHTIKFAVRSTDVDIRPTQGKGAHTHQT